MARVISPTGRALRREREGQRQWSRRQLKPWELKTDEQLRQEEIAGDINLVSGALSLADQFMSSKVGGGLAAGVKAIATAVRESDRKEAKAKEAEAREAAQAEAKQRAGMLEQMQMVDPSRLPEDAQLSKIEEAAAARVAAQTPAPVVTPTEAATATAAPVATPAPAPAAPARVERPLLADETMINQVAAGLNLDPAVVKTIWKAMEPGYRGEAAGTELAENLHRESVDEIPRSIIAKVYAGISERLKGREAGEALEAAPATAAVGPVEKKLAEYLHQTAAGKPEDTQALVNQFMSTLADFRETSRTTAQARGAVAQPVASDDPAVTARWEDPWVTGIAKKKQQAAALKATLDQLYPAGGSAKTKATQALRRILEMQEQTLRESGFLPKGVRPEMPQPKPPEGFEVVPTAAPADRRVAAAGGVPDEAEGEDVEIVVATEPGSPAALYEQDPEAYRTAVAQGETDESMKAAKATADKAAKVVGEKEEKKEKEEPVTPKPPETPEEEAAAETSPDSVAVDEEGAAASPVPVVSLSDIQNLPLAERQKAFAALAEGKIKIKSGRSLGYADLDTSDISAAILELQKRDNAYKTKYDSLPDDLPSTRAGLETLAASLNLSPQDRLKVVDAMAWAWDVMPTSIFDAITGGYIQKARVNLPGFFKHGAATAKDAKSYSDYWFAFQNIAAADRKAETEQMKLVNAAMDKLKAERRKDAQQILGIWKDKTKSKAVRLAARNELATKYPVFSWLGTVAAGTSDSSRKEDGSYPPVKKEAAIEILEDRIKRNEAYKWTDAHAAELDALIQRDKAETGWEGTGTPPSLADDPRIATEKSFAEQATADYNALNKQYLAEEAEYRKEADDAFGRASLETQAIGNDKRTYHIQHKWSSVDKAYITTVEVETVEGRKIVTHGGLEAALGDTKAKAQKDKLKELTDQRRTRQVNLEKTEDKRAKALGKKEKTQAAFDAALREIESEALTPRQKRIRELQAQKETAKRWAIYQGLLDYVRRGLLTGQDMAMAVSREYVSNPKKAEVLLKRLDAIHGKR